MKTKSIIFGTLAGTITMFLLGFIVFGVALAGYMEANSNPAVSRPADQMNFPALVLSNFMWALLIAVFIERSGSRSVMEGAKTGAIAGFLGILGFDLTMFATTRLYTGGFGLIVVDVLAFTILTTCAGGVSGMVMGKTAGSPATVAS